MQVQVGTLTIARAFGSLPIGWSSLAHAPPLAVAVIDGVLRQIDKLPQRAHGRLGSSYDLFIV